MQLTPEKEKEFQSWWDANEDVQAWKDEIRRKYNEEPEVETPVYDYRAAFMAGVVPRPSSENNGDLHWDSRFKGDWHPNRFVARQGKGILDSKADAYVKLKPSEILSNIKKKKPLLSMRDRDKK